MATSSQNKEAHTSVTQSQRIAIAEINQYNTRGYHIEADIVLVWPYSSATKQLSLLLAERDVSLKAVTGQIKVTFYEAAAKAVANARPGIGQSLELDIDGASIEQETEIISTPGKKAFFSLHFYSDVALKLSGKGQPGQAVDFTASPTPSSAQIYTNGHQSPGVYDFNTPIPDRPVNLSHSRLSLGSARTNWYSSPFTDEDADTSGHRRKRTKFARSSGAWRLTDTSDDEVEPVNAQSLPSTALDKGTGTKPSSPASVAFSMRDGFSDTGLGRDDIPRDPGAPPPTQYLPTPTAATAMTTPEPTNSQAHEAPTPNYAGADTPRRQLHVDLVSPVEANARMPTPKLGALASPGLPLVSPLIPRNAYFPNIAAYSNAASELDASSRTQSSILNAFLAAAEASAEPVDNAVPDEVPVRIGQIEHSTVANVTPIPDMRRAEDIASEVDLEHLQQQIDLEHAGSEPSDHDGADEVEGFPSRAFSVGDIHTGQNSPALRSVAIEIPASQMSNRDEPIVLDSDDGSDDDDDDELSTSKVELKAHQQDRVRDTRLQLPQPESREEVSSLLLPGTRVSNQHIDDLLWEKETTVDAVYERLINEEDGHQKRNGSTTLLHSPKQIDEGDASDVVDDGSPISTAYNIAEPQTPSLERRTQEIVADFGPTPTGSSRVLVDDATTDVVTEFAADQDATMADGWERLAQNLFAPQATLVEPATDEVVSEQEKVTLEKIPPIPEESQKAVELETPIAPEVIAQIEQHAPQLDGPLTSPTPRRSLRGKVLAIDDLYSEYFTPRKSTKLPAEVSTQSHNVDQAEEIGEQAPAPAIEQPVRVEDEKSRKFTYTSSPYTAGEQDTGAGTHTSHGYYVRLTNLTEYFNQLMDVLAVCTTKSTTPEKAETGPRDFHTTLHLVDASKSQDVITITSQIFRPRKNVLPSTKRGDVVLLRNFKVQTREHKPLLLSTDESSWAVFHTEDSSQNEYTVSTPGPPIELGDQEHEAVSNLFNWWSTQGQRRFPESPSIHSPVTAISKASETKKPPPAPLDLRRSPRIPRQQQLNDGAFSPTRLRSSSPTLNPQTPITPSIATGQTTMPPPQRTTTQTSPTSSPSTRTSPRHTRHKSRASLSSPTSSSPPQPISISRPRTRSQTFLAAPDTPLPLIESTPRQVSDSNSAVDSMSAASSSSTRKRRLERRSTSLIHELRDGKEWVDVESSEIVSVSSQSGGEESDDEDGERHDEHDDAGEIVRTGREASVEIPEPESAVVEHMSTNDDGHEVFSKHEPAQPTTPTRTRGPGRCRASTVGKAAPTQPPQQNQPLEDPQPAEGRITRSKAAKGVEAMASASTGKDDNVHELRDGARYRD